MKKHEEVKLFAVAVGLALASSCSAKFESTQTPSPINIPVEEPITKIPSQAREASGPVDARDLFCVSRNFSDSISYIRLDLSNGESGDLEKMRFGTLSENSTPKLFVLRTVETVSDLYYADRTEFEIRLRTFDGRKENLLVRTSNFRDAQVRWTNAQGLTSFEDCTFLSMRAFDDGKHGWKN